MEENPKADANKKSGAEKPIDNSVAPLQDEKTVAPGKLGGTVYVIPPGGSLALLALGYRGLQMWRAERDGSQKADPKKG